jgi:hypothetical protein
MYIMSHLLLFQHSDLCQQDAPQAPYVHLTTCGGRYKLTSLAREDKGLAMRYVTMDVFNDVLLTAFGVKSKKLVCFTQDA